VEARSSERADSPASRDPAGAAAEHGDMSREEHLRAEHARADSYVEQLEQRTMREVGDSDWEGELSDVIVAQLDATGGAVSLEQIRCTTTLCRLELRQTTDDAHVRLLQQLGLNPAFHGGLFSRRQTDPSADGSYRTVVFLSRPGMALPPDESDF
jgi:hypothetical protein